MKEAARERIRGALRLDLAFRLIWGTDARRTVISLALIVLGGLAPTAALLLIREIVDGVVAAISGEQTVASIVTLVAIAGGVAVIAATVQAIAGHMESALTQRVVDHVLSGIQAKSVTLDVSYYEDPAYHDTLHRAQEEAPYRPGYVLSDLFAFAQNAVTLIGIAGLLIFTFHWLFVLVLLLTAIPVIAIRLAYAQRFFNWHRTRTTVQRRVHYLNFLLTGSWHAKEIRAYSLGDLFRDRSKHLRSELRSERLDIQRKRTAVDLVARVSQTAVLFALIGYVVVRVINQEQTVGDIIMLYQAFQRGQSVINGMMSSLGNLYENNLFLSYYAELMWLEPKVTDPPAPVPAPSPVRESLVLDGVTFRYPHRTEYAVRDVSLTVRPGEIVAVTGENGAGKSTLIRLAARLHDPTAGRLLIDSVDLRDMAVNDLRSTVGVLFQDPANYYVSAEDNVWYGDVSKPPDTPAIIAATKRSGADETITRLPREYETVLGTWFDDGAELSTGQWKRIALARLYYASRQIILLDEPTSALDASAEAGLLRALDADRGNRLVLLVSHRMSTVAKADRVYVMDAGRVVQTGSPAELVRKDGPYKRLCETQGLI